MSTWPSRWPSAIRSPPAATSSATRWRARIGRCLYVVDRRHRRCSDASPCHCCGSARHRLRVLSVVTEGPGVTSIEMGGRHCTASGPSPDSSSPGAFSPAIGGGRRTRSRCRPHRTGGACASRSRGWGTSAPVWPACRSAHGSSREGPYGTFTAAGRHCPRALLIAGGAGITPIRALLEDMPGEPGEIAVVYRHRARTRPHPARRARRPGEKPRGGDPLPGRGRAGAVGRRSARARARHRGARRVRMRLPGDDPGHARDCCSASGCRTPDQAWRASRYEARAPRAGPDGGGGGRAGALSHPSPAHSQSARGPRGRPRVRVRQTRPGVRTATGPPMMTPFSLVQVRVTLTDGRLTGVQTVALTGDGPAHPGAQRPSRADPAPRGAARPQRADRLRQRGHVHEPGLDPSRCVRPSRRPGVAERRTEHVMGTAVTIEIRDRQRAGGGAARRRLTACAGSTQLFSPYNPASEISALNAGPSLRSATHIRPCARCSPAARRCAWPPAAPSTCAPRARARSTPAGW